jgi:hypothetical protein
VNTPDYLTRLYQKDDHPFVSLNDLPFEKANEVKKRHCAKYNIGLFYAQHDYLIHRRKIEKWLHGELIRKGGNPQSEVPVYMILGEPPTGDFDIRVSLQKNAEEIRVPISAIDILAVTFTYPDSMYDFVYDNDGHIIGGTRTNTPKVYLYNELKDLINAQNVFDPYIHPIEAQVWDRESLNLYWEGQQ